MWKEVQEKCMTHTRRELVHALLRLMEKYPYNVITITEITQEAKIARRTFYLNYKNKEEILIDYIQYLYQDYNYTIQETPNRSMKSDAHFFFSFWKHHHEFLTMLNRNGLNEFLIRENKKTMEISPLFTTDKIHVNQFKPNIYSYLYSAISAVLCCILFEWLNTGMQNTEEELAEYFTTIINDVYASENK